MKLRLEDHRKSTAALLVALLLASRLLYQPETWAPLTSSPKQLAYPATPHNKRSKSEASPDPTLDYHRLELVEHRLYQGTGRNIFRSQVATPSIKTVVPPEPSPPSPVIDTVVTPIPLRFFGFAAVANEPRKAFLGEGDAIFVANEGDIVDRRYRVLKIDTISVVVEDLIEKSIHHLLLPTGASTG